MPDATYGIANILSHAVHTHSATLSLLPFVKFGRHPALKIMYSFLGSVHSQLFIPCGGVNGTFFINSSVSMLRTSLEKFAQVYMRPLFRCRSRSRPLFRRRQSVKFSYELVGQLTVNPAIFLPFLMYFLFAVIYIHAACFKILQYQFRRAGRGLNNVDQLITSASDVAVIGPANLFIYFLNSLFYHDFASNSVKFSFKNT